MTYKYLIIDDEPLYIESLDDFVKGHLTNRVLVSRENISPLESKLPAERFGRIHRSFIVSMHHLGAISSEEWR